jgi:hypothetical protein
MTTMMMIATFFLSTITNKESLGLFPRRRRRPVVLSIIRMTRGVGVMMLVVDMQHTSWRPGSLLCWWRLLLLWLMGFVTVLLLRRRRLTTSRHWGTTRDRCCGDRGFACFSSSSSSSLLVTRRSHSEVILDRRYCCGFSLGRVVLVVRRRRHRRHSAFMGRVLFRHDLQRRNWVVGKQHRRRRRGRTVGVLLSLMPSWPLLFRGQCTLPRRRGLSSCLLVGRNNNDDDADADDDNDDRSKKPADCKPFSQQGECECSGGW